MVPVERHSCCTASSAGLHPRRPQQLAVPGALPCMNPSSLAAHPVMSPCSGAAPLTMGQHNRLGLKGHQSRQQQQVYQDTAAEAEAAAEAAAGVGAGAAAGAGAGAGAKAEGRMQNTGFMVRAAEAVQVGTVAQDCQAAAAAPAAAAGAGAQEEEEQEQRQKEEQKQGRQCQQRGTEV